VSCADLEKAINAEWRAQQADIECAQAEFHAVDETTARSERDALQARLDGRRAARGSRAARPGAVRGHRRRTGLEIRRCIARATMFDQLGMGAVPAA